MKTLTDRLSSYASYHRDRRNIATHFVGIPLIVLATATLLAGVSTWLAALVFLGAALFFLRLEVRFGVVMAVLLFGALAAGRVVAAQAGSVGLGLGAFVLGWVFQFVGHAFEGRKPAFVDDLVGLLDGPLFIVAETGFALGLRRELHAEIERRVGPTLLRARTANASE